MRHTHNTQKGFALFLTIVIVGIILAATLATIDIGVKELLLSGGDTESQKAFYAADTALECTVYSDRVQSNMSSNNYLSPFYRGAHLIMTNPIKCGGYSTSFLITQTNKPNENIETNIQIPPQTVATTQSIPYQVTESTFKLSFTGTEAFVTVTKKESIAADATGGKALKTRIEVRGYSTQDPNNPRRVERAIRLQY